MNALLTLALVLGPGDEKAPPAKDVVAGWVAFGLFLALGAALVFLAFSMTKQLRKAQAAKDAGVFGDEPVKPEDDAGEE